MLQICICSDQDAHAASQENEQATTSSSTSTSTSGVAGTTPKAEKFRGSRKRRREEDEDSEVLNSIAESLRQPVTVLAPPAAQNVMSPVIACTNFLAALLNDFKSESLKLETMGTLVQTVINAKALDDSKNKEMNN